MLTCIREACEKYGYQQEVIFCEMHQCINGNPWCIHPHWEHSSDDAYLILKSLRWNFQTYLQVKQKYL